MSARPSYSQVHTVMRRDCGKASERTCGCGSRADEWAYLGGDPDEMTDQRGLKYSTDQSLYVAMCLSCHRRMDKGGDSCKRGHAWTSENTGIKSNGRRFCRTCARAAKASWLERHRDEWRAYQREYYRANYARSGAAA